MSKVLISYPPENPVNALEALDVARDAQMLAWLAARLVRRASAEQLECWELKLGNASHDLDVMMREIEGVKRARWGEPQ